MTHEQTVFHQWAASLGVTDVQLALIGVGVTLIVVGVLIAGVGWFAARTE